MSAATKQDSHLTAASYLLVCPKLRRSQCALIRFEPIRNDPRARQAVDLLPIAKESLNGPDLVANLALVYVWTGERDAALEQLETVATIPNGPTYSDLLLNPCWDSLRGDKRFEKIVAAAKAASR